MSLKHLTSKLLAGGMTAGIVLIWWPRHYPTAGLEWLVLRGVIATLGFELLLIAYASLEDRIAARMRRRKAVDRLRARVDAVPAPARAGGSFLFVGAAVALPIMLLATAGTQPVDKAQAKPQKTRVIRQVVVKRKVIRDEVVVHDAAATSTAPSPAAAVPSRRTGAPTATRGEAAPTGGPTSKPMPPQRDTPKTGVDATRTPTPAPTPSNTTPTGPPAATAAPATDANAATGATETVPAG